MDIKEGFAAEIRANPHDDVPRLVYADFLEESGDPQGELIRIQCELAGPLASGRTRAALQAREEELLDAYGETWLEPLRELGAEGIDIRCFRRGLIERVRIDAGRFVAVAGELCGAEPALHCIEFRGAHAAVDALAECAWPSQIVELELTSNRLEATHLQALAGADWRAAIEVLHLGFNRLGDDGVAALAEQEWPGLRRLVLDANRIGPDGARTLSTWSTLRHVEDLGLNLNAIGTGIVDLGRSECLAALRTLELASTGISAEGAAAIAAASWFASIGELRLRNNPLGPEGLRALANSPRETSLRVLDVRNTTAGSYGHRDGVPVALRQRFGEALVADRFEQPAGGGT